MIKIIIADDMEEYRIYFKMFFDNDSEVEVVATADSCEDVVTKTEKYRPDIILMDIQMEEDSSGILATKRIMKEFPDTKIIMVTIHGNRDNIIASYEAGAVDFIEKTASPVEIVTLVKSVAQMKKSANNVIVEEYKRLKSERESMLYLINLISRLSPTELCVIKSVSEGKKYREIADERHCEEVTIRTVASRICTKLGIKPLKKVVETLEQMGVLDIVVQMIKE